MNTEPIEPEEQEPELLTDLPDGYMDTYDYLFQKSMENDSEIPEISLSITAAMVLTSKPGESEVIDQLRLYAEDNVYRQIVDILDLVRKVDPKALEHKWKAE